MAIATKIIHWAATLSLLGFVSACGSNEEPQAAPEPPTPSQATSPAPSIVKRLLETKQCERCDLEGVNLAGADLRKAKLSDALLQGANLQGANLKG